MVDYNRTVWKDHIKDQYDNVIQQGVPASAKNLNNIENQLVILSAKENTLSELVKENIPSGFTSLSDLDYTYMSTNPNAIKLLSDSIAFVNGYKVVIPTGTIIQLDTPPVSGSRDDLVFLECWKQTDVNGSVTWNWRLRVVSGVDFSKFGMDGIRTNDYYNIGAANNNYAIAPQGALANPITANWQTCFESAKTIYARGFKETSYSEDAGLYVAGNRLIAGVNDSFFITQFKTTDGYVYAIPMFRVHRRNSGGYSVTNGNGGNAYYATSAVTMVDGSTGFSAGSQGSTKQIQVLDTSMLTVGDYLIRADQDTTANVATMQVVSIESSTLFTVKNLNNASTGSLYNLGYKLKLYPTRKDKTYNNIIDIRDIIDLRHQVSLTGFNYSQLLEENFDKLLRGELQTNAKTTMLKHYHGIAKTPIDSNHVFYASFDGTAVAEVGGTPSSGAVSRYGNSVTGQSMCASSALTYAGNSNLTGSITIDLWLAIKSLGISESLVKLMGPNGSYIVLKLASDSALHIDYYDGVKSVFDYRWITLSSDYNGKTIHVRAIINNSNTVAVLYVNGKSMPMLSSIAGASISNIFPMFSSVLVSGVNVNYISDLSISNIDRGATFATLPQDFIDGYARISPAFNEQRNVYSDALTSETDFVQVKATGSNGKAISTTQGTAGAWVNADKVKVKGLGGEIITGVIDSDTVVARVTNIISSNNSITHQFKLDNINGMVVGDTFSYCYTEGVYTGTFSGQTLTIQSIEPSTNIVTFLTGSAVTYGYLGVITETTASSSSPKVQFLNGATLTDVTGTWSGLGTNEATFTLGTNASLTTQDLYLTYGLNEVAGQGGISEVLTATLAGESNGKKLTANPTVHVRDDFASKVAGITAINPNIAKRTTTNSTNTSLLVPSAFGTELTDDLYANLSTLNGINVSSTTNVNGAIAQQLLSFNLIRILEDKFGPLPCGSDLASKIAYAKANVSKLTCNWWVYGTCPSGNRCTTSWYNFDTSTWTGSSLNNNKPTVDLLSNYTAAPASRIDSNGFVHMLAYTDPSDGVTASTVYSDYCSIEVVLNTPAGYDVLAPENPRRDDGKANILLVRKETKEIQSMFNRSNTDGVVTYGDYLPYQGLGLTILYTDSTLSIKAKNKNFIGDVGTGGYKSALTGIKESQLPTGVNRSYYMNSNNIGYFKLEDINNLISVNNNDLVNLLVDILRSYNSNSLGNLFASSATKKLRGFSFNHQTPRYIDVSNLLSKFNLSVNSYIITGLVVSYQGNLYLVIARSDVNGDKTVWFGNSSTNAAVDVFYMPNRPLIK